MAFSLRRLALAIALLGSAPALAESPAPRAEIRNLIDQGRATGDERFYGYAEAKLSPLLAITPEDPSLRMLRAVIAQAGHDFDAALNDLDFVIDRSPRAAQARLTRAFLHMTRGAYDLAFTDCAAMPPSAGRLSRSACHAWLLGLTGDAAKGYALLDVALAAQPDASAGSRAWASSLLADMAWRLGDYDKARLQFERALALSAGSNRVASAYAQFKLERGEPQAALDLLVGAHPTDAVLLTRARAARALGREDEESLAILHDRFTAGASIHLREHAIFALHLLEDPAKALDLAEANWATQREPADLRLLVEAAEAAGTPRRASVARAWQDTHGTEFGGRS
ncbi:MAG: hypothetical protein AAF415_14270 [Pseudomonadota bacterium]